MASESPIVQVPEPDNYDQDDMIYQQHEDDGFDSPQDAIPRKLKLDLRGTRVELDRDVLVNLPESLLIAMFPNGLVLGRQDDVFVDDDEDDYENHSRDSVGGMDEQVNYVDFDPACLDYVLRFYQYAQEVYQKSDSNDHQRLLAQSAATSPMYYPLLTKQPIIVLREELEYYCLTSKDSDKKSLADMQALKLAGGKYLKQHDQIFDALQKNISRENNVAEQHLIDMLCDAGFMRDDRWGYRELEPMRTCIVSMALVLLKTTGPDNHMATAQKLLLFWRKPARKCWWDGNTVEVEGESIRLWARRTWTLELALV
ncbi:uncharacterized protein BYT42DRAFT_497138 [Radiomyces spectabilis]|uniref:uncharacterized protein n=1 Tax=Radiomyces spectabilis TaxID=64574 RepID=UPI00221F7349|nr:uncharacterized protein BYT42DRAFT_497138 [Radiomyces spectabilis]KAI8377879.1 hypothetical protein BYT42DRAFT_497138 [Radiomyces spectabilis]